MVSDDGFEPKGLTMNKNALTAALADKTGISRAKAGEVLTALFEAETGGIIADALTGGDKVSIPGFGVFGTKVRAARTGVNPATQAKIQIPAKNSVFFRPGKTLKERISD
ncbi:MAG: DNA-binding protein HU-beta [Myxococcota bacterium]|jgi:DNA-binding protein HU-beta